MENDALNNILSQGNVNKKIVDDVNLPSTDNFKDLSITHSIGSADQDEKRTRLKQEQLRLKTAQNISDALLVELKDKNILRNKLVLFLMKYFNIVTCGIGFIILQPIVLINSNVKIALITGLFGNLLGLLIVVYKYAFADTSKSTKDIDILIKRTNSEKTELSEKQSSNRNMT